ncbi:MAG: hypothetical protein QOF77_2239 [Solirubrobacteraceae bacterium]|jgi:hypothetical protein|nr:hypothetical protein [Solirubrobacteraceae bacterium]
MRSRAVYLPLACCFSTPGPSAWTASLRSCSSWPSFSPKVSGARWRCWRGVLRLRGGARLFPGEGAMVRRA